LASLSRRMFALSLAAWLAACGAARSEAIEWSEDARLAPQSLLLGAVGGEQRIIAVGERGHVLVSSNRGVDWIQARVPTRSMLTAVASVGEQLVWAAGHDAVIVHSADGGETWTRQFFAPEEECPLLDIWFEDAEHGLAVGAYGLVLETRDGGGTWARRAVDEEERHWNAIARAANGSLFVAAEFGSVFRSRDGGKNWTALETPYEGSFFGVLGLADGAVLVFGLRGNIYRSEDGGESWRRLPTDTTASLTQGVQLAGGRVVIVGLGGAMLVSRDGGRTFTNLDRRDRRGLSAIVEACPGSVFVFGEGGVQPAGDLRRRPVVAESETPEGP